MIRRIGTTRTSVRRVALGALSAALAVTMAACTSSSPKPTAAPHPTSSATAALAPPSGDPGARPAVWTACPDLAEEFTGVANNAFTFDCATIQVPQDWHNPGNGKIFNIALARVRSKTQSAASVPSSSTPAARASPASAWPSSWPTRASKFPKAITDKFDLVGFDPRGVGDSTDVKCLTSATEDSLFAADPDPISQADFDAVVALNKRAVDRRAAPNTARAAPLLDRAGRPRYGCGPCRRRRSKDHIPRLLVRDASRRRLRPTVPDPHPRHRARRRDRPDAGLVARSEGQAAGFEHAFNDFSTWCKANAVAVPDLGQPPW